MYEDEFLKTAEQISNKIGLDPLKFLSVLNAFSGTEINTLMIGFDDQAQAIKDPVVKRNVLNLTRQDKVQLFFAVDYLVNKTRNFSFSEEMGKFLKKNSAK